MVVLCGGSGSADDGGVRCPTHLSAGTTAVEQVKQEHCLILQYDNRESPPYPELRRYNEQYAARHGYDYLLHDGRFPEGQQKKKQKPVCPFWGKVLALKERLPHYSAVLFLDTDAVVHDMARPLPALFPPGKEFVFSGDIQGLYKRYTSPFCAGVLAVRSTPRMQELLDRWLLRYRPEKCYVTEQGQWVCEGDWAGRYYEQGKGCGRHTPPKPAAEPYNREKIRSCSTSQAAGAVLH